MRGASAKAHWKCVEREATTDAVHESPNQREGMGVV